MGLEEHVNLEFDILCKNFPEHEILPFREEIIKLCLRFAFSGQSGGSAPFTASAIIAELRNAINENIINEISKDIDSITYEFTHEINELSQKIKKESIIFSDELINCLKKLLLEEPIFPLSGIDDEWYDVSEYNGKSKSWFQNKRCHGLFKDGEKERPYYLDAIVNKDQNSNYYSGLFWLNKKDFESGDRSLMVGKKAFIKSFPFDPKTFIVDVVDIEIDKNDFETFIKDINQLEDVKKYYDLY